MARVSIGFWRRPRRKGDAKGLRASFFLPPGREWPPPLSQQLHLISVVLSPRFSPPGPISPLFSPRVGSMSTSPGRVSPVGRCGCRRRFEDPGAPARVRLIRRSNGFPEPKPFPRMGPTPALRRAPIRASSRRPAGFRSPRKQPTLVLQTCGSPRGRRCAFPAFADGFTSHPQPRSAFAGALAEIGVGRPLPLARFH